MGKVSSQARSGASLDRDGTPPGWGLTKLPTEVPRLISHVGNVEQCVDY